MIWGQIEQKMSLSNCENDSSNRNHRIRQTPGDPKPRHKPRKAAASSSHVQETWEGKSRKENRQNRRANKLLTRTGCDLPRCPAPEHKNELASKGARQFRVSTKLGVFADCAILCSTVSKDSKHVRSQSLVSRRTPRLAMFTAPSSTFLRWVLTGCLQHDCNDEAAQSNYTEGMCRDQCKAPPIIYLTHACSITTGAKSASGCAKQHWASAPAGRVRRWANISGRPTFKRLKQ